MNSYAAALSQHPLATQAVGETAGAVLEQLGGEPADLVVVFASTHHLGALEDIAAALHRLLEPRVMLGGGAVAIVGGGHEIEEEPALSVFAANAPEAQLVPARLEAVPTPDGPTVVGWPDGVTDAHTLLLFADPYTFPADGFAARCSDDAPGLRIVGGLASAAGRGGNRMVLNDAVRTDGAVGVFVGGALNIATVVSQGCRPIGRPLTVTRAEGNLVYELGGQSALQRLAQVALEATDSERELMRRGLHVGLVVDEHRVDFERGDFLVRNVLGADEASGALAVGDLVTVGQTLQFHVRDADAADEDLRELLTGAVADAALLFTCNGRGRALFGVDDHDAGLVEKLLGPVPVAGAFCAGELGPVGGRNYLHGFTASLALFSS